MLISLIQKIICHLFCKFFDLLLPAEALYGQTAFTYRHYIDKTNEISNYFYLIIINYLLAKFPTKSGIYICKTQKHPPHYNVIYNANTLETQPGRNNIFYTLVLFVHIIKTKFDGYIDSLWIGDPNIGLLNVVK